MVDSAILVVPEYNHALLMWTGVLNSNYAREVGLDDG